MSDTAQSAPALLGEMPGAEFRAAGHAVIDWIAAYLEHPEHWRVLPETRPGEVAAALPAAAPERGEPMARILDDFERLIPAHTTHWNHPGFFAYFGITGSAPGILAESLIAALNVNAMLWRSGPAATELEQVTVGWLRSLLGLPADFDGHINDTASSSTLVALAAAREAQTDLRVRAEGLPGRPDVPRLRVYCSEEAHSSVDKDVITLGLGMSGVRRLPTDAALRMDVSTLERAIAEDRAAGVRPIAVVATLGTTSTTSIDPVLPIAEVCRREGLWLHVDAAYGGAGAVLPELRPCYDGWELADSIVMNPHKWLFTPIDCSVLFVRRPEVLKRAFSLVPEYLTTPQGDAVRNLMDYGVALGRRFRALKLWFVLRYYGQVGLQARIREHIRLAQVFAAWVDEHPDFERLAPVPFSTVVFRHCPPGVSEAAAEVSTARLLERLNATGEVFLSHTRVKGTYGLRLAIGNIRTTEAHVARAWELIQQLA
ncbi:MAG: amino acid decarboxylase [Gemmatimonadetes bacterium]|nr:amino acid decarboxylase [Gemmatimonadota bacterium]